MANKKYTPGAENKILLDRLAEGKQQYNNDPCPVLVLIYDLNNQDEIVKQVELDYGKFEDRKTLGKLTFWAISNHHSIETFAMSDVKPDMKENG